MPDITETAVEQGDLDKPANDEADLARKWNAEINAAEKAQAKWVARAKKVEAIYNDERDISSGRARKFNVLWSNVETLRPAVYMQTPKARAARRHRSKDPIARFGALLIERCVQVSCDLYDFDEEVDQAVRDRLVVGRGQMWVSYEPVIVGSGKDETLAYENCVAEYVPWQDFLHSVCRTWRENWWVGRNFYKTRRELAKWMKEKGLDAKKAQKVALDHSADGDKTDDGHKDERAKCRVVEVWDKRDGVVRFVAPGSGEYSYLGELPPKPNFRDFFPCPMPMLATTTSKSLIPTPDYAMYQDQAEELNKTQDRIVVLQKALKVAGCYNAQNTAIGQLLTSGDNEMIPVENWEMFAEGGKAGGNIEWYPVEVVIKVLEGLYLIRDQAKQTLYEVSGIGDILRGATDPDETATAQGIKAKWGSLRVRRTQKKGASFIDQVFERKAEVICELFGFKSIMEMAGVDEELLEKYCPAPPQPEMPPMQPGQQPDPMMQQQMQQQAQVAKMQARAQFLSQVEKLLRSDATRAFRVTVQPDSMLEPDRQEEKEVAVEFLTAVGGYLQQAAPLAAMGPEAAKFAGDLLMFAVRRFDKVDELEESVEAFIEAMAKPRPPQPNPEMMKVEAEIKGKKAELEMKGEAQKQELGMKREMHQMDMQAKVQEVQIDGAIKQQEMQQEAVAGQQKLELQAQQGEQQWRQGEQQGELAQRQGDQKMKLAERAQDAKERAVREGSPPE